MKNAPKTQNVNSVHQSTPGEFMIRNDDPFLELRKHLLDTKKRKNQLQFHSMIKKYAKSRVPCPPYE